MKPAVEELIDELRDLEQRLQRELHAKGEQLAFTIERGKVQFAEELRQKNRQWKIGVLSYIRDSRILVMLSAPAIYMLIVPFVFLDLMVSLYQAICFPVYGINKVKRADYLVFDRVKLDYLNGIEKFNCAYCTYCNGIIAFVREIAARTEQYWCPIKHAQAIAGTHERYPKFTDFGDGAQFRGELKRIKRELGEPAHKDK
ncbi:MAG: hypothetical protein HKN50_13570 [Gammaproteobacteria bacterium]|nr:hypothetical protein [Gammaproteobacteria bacterium]